MRNRLCRPRFTYRSASTAPREKFSMRPILMWAACTALMLNPVAYVRAAVSADQPAYPIVKIVIAKMYRQNPWQRTVILKEDGVYSLDSCTQGYDFVGNAHGARIHRTSRIGVFTDIAYYVTKWETDLPALGYPRYVWQPWVSKYEASAIRLSFEVSSQEFYEKWTDSKHPRFKTFKTCLKNIAAATPIS